MATPQLDRLAALRTAPLPTVLAVLYLVVLLIAAVFGTALAAYLAPGGVLALAYLLYIRLRQQQSTVLEYQLLAGLRHPEKWPVYAKPYPLYKFVDIYRGAQAFVEQYADRVEVRSEHNESLRMILNHKFGRDRNRQLKPATMVARKVSYAEEAFFPVDTFWRVRPDAGADHGAVIVRVRFAGSGMQLEIAAEREADARSAMDRILQQAQAESIYRNQLIGVAFGPQVRGAFADPEEPSYFDLVFQKETPIPDEAIIFDQHVRTILEHAIVDFHHRRDTLMQLGLPGKRGILFYGPPGTGKTYTCKYLFQQLKPVTAIVATGNALAQIKAVCAVAKMFQPSLVILEDVDLVFSNRETNMYTTILGDFMDQLDGFGDNDEVLFILTTNAIERVESAIKDRPGRISQCIYFGPPTPTLRRGYLETLLRPYDTAALNLEQVIAKTEGVSQAFLKELVYRAVQIATEGDGLEPRAALDTEAMLLALREMTEAGGRQGKRIIGFQVEA